MPNLRKPRLGEKGYAASVARRRRPLKGLLSIRQEKAAALLAEDRISNLEIAKQCGISFAALKKWREDPIFQERVVTNVQTFADRFLKKGLARQENRLAALDNLYERLIGVIDQRARDPKLRAYPGGDTGLVTRTLRGIGSGEDYQVFTELKTDTDIVREIRGILRDYAEELGQIKQRQRDITGDGLPAAPPIININFVKADNGKVAEDKQLDGSISSSS